MQLVDEVTFQIYIEKIGEIKFQKNHSKISWRNYPRFFSEKFKKMMIGIGLLTTAWEYR